MGLSDLRRVRRLSFGDVHCPLLACLLALGVVLLAAPAVQAAGIPGARATELATVPLRVTETEFRADPMRRASKSWPAWESAGEEGSDELVVEGRLGRGPWRLFEGTFPEESCHSPRVSETGTTALALCEGLDVSRLEDQHIVFVQDGVLSRYRFPVVRLPEPARTQVALAPDGKRFAVLTGEGDGRSVHLVNLETGKDFKFSGGFRDAGNPVVSSGSDTVAFVAQVGRDRAVLVVSPQAESAIVVRRARSGLSVHGLSADGKRVMLVGDTNDRSQLMMVDLVSEKMTLLSHRKSAVTSVSLDASGDYLAYAADVGGICGLYWVDLQARRRTELQAGVETCFELLGMDGGRRHLLLVETQGSTRSLRIRARRSMETRYKVIKGCSEPALSADGRLMTVRCPKARMGGGSYLFLLPPPRDDE